MKQVFARRNHKAAVCFGAILIVCFSHKLTGVAGGQLLHDRNAAGCFNVLLIFTHRATSKSVNKKAPCPVQVRC